MAYPVVELIAQDIFDTLDAIKEANGWHYDLRIERAKRTGNVPDHLKVVVYQDDPSELEANPTHTKSWLQPFELAVYIIPRENDETASDTYSNVLWADISKALMADHTRGGNAHDTFIRPPTHFSEINGEFDGFVFKVDVQYRTELTDPYAIAG
jgi:hypothetical protein